MLLPWRCLADTKYAFVTNFSVLSIQIVMMCEDWNPFAEKLLQGRRGVAGPVGIIGPRGTVVCHTWNKLSHLSSLLYLSTLTALCTSTYRVLEERRAIMGRLWVLFAFFFTLCLLYLKSGTDDNIRAENMSSLSPNRDFKVQGYVCIELSFSGCYKCIVLYRGHLNESVEIHKVWTFLFFIRGPLAHVDPLDFQ